MSLWGKPTSKSKLPVVRIEKVPVKKVTVEAPKVLPKRPNDRLIPKRATPSLSARSSSTSLRGSSPSSTPRKQAISRKRSPAYNRLESDSSDDSDASEDARQNKRQKVADLDAQDPTRRLIARKPFSERDSRDLIHARSIASLKLNFRRFFTDSDEVEVALQYPGSSVRERYELVYRNDCFDPIEEILGVVKEFGEFFVDGDMKDTLLNPDTGIYRKLERARNLKTFAGFKNAISLYNNAVQSLRSDGKLQESLEQKHSLPESLVVRIMTQAYDRAVSPKVDLLRKYENGTNEIYGELKSNLVYKILVETGITSKQVFVDLGSGVANVVLQAALQVGCESWGCEIMENACKLADAQKIEFEARCRLWGIQPGRARLERGDFMLNEKIRSALQRADVVLVNNEVFTPELNVSLVNLFLDLKEGCKIVSLKSFVPPNRKITSYNKYDPSNILEVEKKTYSTKSVSWKDEGGDYYVATKNSARLQQVEDSE